MRQLILIIATIFIVLAPKVHAQSLSSLSLFARCYAHLTGLPLPLNHPTKTSIINGTITAEKACADLLDEVALDTSTSSALTPDGKLILNRLYEFHRSWFSNGVFEQIEAYVSTPATYNFLDSTEPALAITYQLANPGARYENVLRGSQGYIGLRTPDSSISTRLFSTTHSLPIRRSKTTAEYSDAYLGFRTTSVYDNVNFGTTHVVLMPAIQIGNLTGVKLQDQVVNVPNYWPGFSRFNGNPSKAENATGTSGMAVNFNFFENQGGGVLGLNTNILINWGHPIGQLSDGSLKLPRRWISETLHSMLCKELPILRESDVLSFIDNTGREEVAPWRTGTNCLVCHATMDPLASTARNLVTSQTDFSSRTIVNPASNKIVASSYIMGRFIASDTTTPYSWSPVPVPDFHKMKPRGKVYFRTFSGQLINTEVENMEAAGVALSNTEDLYQCATKRYFEYLTGITVPLYDRGDPRFTSQTAALPPAALKNRQFIEGVAKRFQNSQSLRSMIKEIMSSSYYKDANYLNGGTP